MSKLMNLIDTAKPFVLLGKAGRVSCYQGKLHTLEKLDQIDTLARQTQHDIVFALPYHTIRERGFEAEGDEPLLAMEAEIALTLPAEHLTAELPDQPIVTSESPTPNLSDEEYAAIVASFQKNEIEGGQASQATISRFFSGKLDSFKIETVLSIYRKVLGQQGAYMAILYANINTDDFAKSTFIIGASPERHLEIRGNDVIMMPIAGTLRKEDQATFESRINQFINDPKEINELFQVVDEEMKMMGIICPEGGRIEGPFLHEIGAVVHTEYRLIGRRSRNSITALRHTLHAPTVVGSPMESAARIIRKYEKSSRRYYAGEVGVYACPRGDAADGDLDCAILLRCGEIDGSGRFRVQSGGGLVRDSDPLNEARESRAKAMGLLGLLSGAQNMTQTYLTQAIGEKLAPVLESRNANLSSFWMQRQNPYEAAAPSLDGLKVTILNNEDDFAHMIGHVLNVMKTDVKIIDSLSYIPSADDAEIVIIGPGPGDPSDMSHPRMKKLQETIALLKKARKPMLGICLGHQAISIAEGLTVTRQTASTQGMQRKVMVRGTPKRLGFYNSFSPVEDDAAKSRPDLSYDTDDQGRIIALFAKGFIGYQFHPESIMSADGASILYETIKQLRGN